jgi:ATP:cob(I)alamin adenosyltransferase
MGRVYTRTGDGGVTRLGSGKSVPKDSIRVELYGVIDEASSALGIARGLAAKPVAGAILELQRELVKLMGRISLYDLNCQVVSAEELEGKIEAIRDIVPMPDVFVEPGESPCGGALHLARAIFRRAEREAVTLSREEDFEPEIMKTINRMSDYVYALAEWADHEDRVSRITRAVLERIGEKNTESNSDVVLCEAEALIAAMKAASDGGGVPMAMAVCDSAGNLVAFSRQENVLPVSVGLAQKKAFTATQLKCPTSDLAGATQPGAMLWGLQADPNLVVFGGGIPLYLGGKIRGAVGVSGGTVDEDVAVAEAAVKTWESLR